MQLERPHYSHIPFRTRGRYLPPAEARPTPAVQELRLRFGEFLVHLLRDPDNRLAQFEHWRHSDGLWRRDLQFPECIYNEDEEAQNIKPESVLNYPLDSDDLFDPSGYDAPGFFPTELDKTSRSPLRVMWVHHASIRDASH